MIETWRQWTCDGCGKTEYMPHPNMSLAEVRDILKSDGFKQYPGDLLYCPDCVKRGIAARRVTTMDE